MLIHVNPRKVNANHMKFWNNLFKRETTTSTSSDGSATYNGRVVSVYSSSTALKIAAVYRAYSLITDSVGALPLIYKRHVKSGDYFKPYTEVGGKDLYYLLTVKPNRRQTAFTFFKTLVGEVLLQGNAYAYIRYGLTGNPQELILLSPGCVSYSTLTDTYYVSDVYNDVVGSFGSDEILHFKNLSLDGGYTGMSTISFAAQALSIAATADNETLTRFSTGGKVKGLFHNDYTAQGFGEYQDDQMEAVVTDIQTQLDEGKDIIRIAGDGKFEQLSLSAIDMQFLENRKFTVTEIARFFNVPKSKLFDDTNATYKSSEMSTVEFYTDCLDPILTMIENEFNAKLISQDFFGELKFKFDVSKLYTTDLTTKANWQTKQLANGTMTVNDLRRSEDLPPIEGGDVLLVSANLINGVEKSGETSQESKPVADKTPK